MDRASIRLFALAFVAVVPASAQQRPRPTSAPNVAAPVPVPRTAFIQTMDAEFANMDADKNKVVTRAEIEQFQRAAGAIRARDRARTLFARLDSDRNGRLSIAEFERLAAAPARPNAAPTLAQADLNRDGRITLVEYRTAKLANFDRMDADKDGVVSVAELKAAGIAKQRAYGEALAEGPADSPCRCRRSVLTRLPGDNAERAAVSSGPEFNRGESTTFSD